LSEFGKLTESVARENAVIVRYEENEVYVFLILSDSSSAIYLWDSLLDAMSEFNGHIIGLDSLAADA